MEKRERISGVPIANYFDPKKLLNELAWRNNQIYLWPKKTHGEVSLRRSVLFAKCPYGEMSYVEKAYGEKS